MNFVSVGRFLRIFWIGFVISTGSATELPCDFYDSINITGGIQHTNQSITFNGIEYASKQYAPLNYDFVNGTQVRVKTYLRGCSCEIKTCVRLCCPFGTYVSFEFQSSAIKSCDKDEAAKQFNIKMMDINDDVIDVSSDHLSYVDGLCVKQYFGDNITIYDVSVNYCVYILSKSLSI